MTGTATATMSTYPRSLPALVPSRSTLRSSDRLPNEPNSATWISLLIAWVRAKAVGMTMAARTERRTPDSAGSLARTKAASRFRPVPAAPVASGSLAGSAGPAGPARSSRARRRAARAFGAVAE